MEAHRLYKATKRKRTVYRGKFLAAAFALTLAVGFSIFFGSSYAAAHGNSQEEPVDYKYYKSIEISAGDTLWGIAESYMNERYESVNDYIDEIKEINGLVSDDIQDSQYLTVAYYDTEFK